MIILKIVQFIRWLKGKLYSYYLGRVYVELWSMIGDVSVNGGADEAYRMREQLDAWAQKKGLLKSGEEKGGQS